MEGCAAVGNIPTQPQCGSRDHARDPWL